MAQAKLPPNPPPVVMSARPQMATVNLGKPPQAPWGDQLNAKIVEPQRPSPSRRMGG